MIATSETGWGDCQSWRTTEGLSEPLADEVAPLGIKVTIVEPGYFRIDFLGSRSLTVSPARIDDYTQTAGAVRSVARDLSHNQPGDPTKLAAAIVELAAQSAPPLHALRQRHRRRH
ncbi:hypothetical protein [Pararhizobium sp. BT-229]|uniref:hypothetical protein n=1 Tax=Pararhizobium sp. BT-229 TaxID=2986923 RepID=UPI003559115C